MKRTSWDAKDANPIFSGYIPKSFRAVRIIQLVPQDKGDDETEGVSGTPAATHTAGGFKRYSHTQNALLRRARQDGCR